MSQVIDGINVNSVSYTLNKTPKPPGAWAKAYPDASFEVIHSGNYLDWIGG